MEFKVKTTNEGEFNAAIQKIVDEYKIDYPKLRSGDIKKDAYGECTTFNLSEAFIKKIYGYNPKLVEGLFEIK